MPIYFGLAAADLPLTLDSVGNRWKQEAIRRPEGYPHYHWLQTEAGCGVVELPDGKVKLPAGAGVLLAPGVPHAYYSLSGNWETSFATFSGTLSGAIAQIVGAQPAILVPEEGGGFYNRWVKQVIALYERGELDGPWLSGECYAFLMNFQYGRRSREQARHPLYEKYVRPVMQEIEIHYSQPLTVRELAASVYVTPQYLSRLFQRFVGRSVYAYLTARRIDKAKEWLLNRPEMEIQHVAHHAGFQDASHFIAVFRVATGMTPLEFRRMH